MNNSSKDQNPVLEQAYMWCAKVASNDLTAREQDTLTAWLQESDLNRCAYERAELMWAKFHAIDANDLPQVSTSTAKPSECKDNVTDLYPWRHLRRWFQQLLMPAMASAAFATLVALAFIIQPDTFQKGDIYQTAAGHIQAITLADNTAITLGADSKIRVNYDAESRNIELVHGEAYFDVETNKTRPFKVSVEETTITVVGTEFSVREGANAIDIAVAEGRVKVDRSDATTNSAATLSADASCTHAQDKPFLLCAGEHAQIRTSKSAIVSSIPIADIGAWRDGRLIYVNTPFEEVMADVARYYPGKIWVRSTEVGSKNINMVFNSDDIDGLFTTLEHALPIKVNRWLGGRIVTISDRVDPPK